MKNKEIVKSQGISYFLISTIISILLANLSGLMKLSSKDWRVLFLFLVLVHLFYYPTWNAGFVTDFTGLQERIESSNFWGIFNSFGFPALQQFLNFFLYVFYKAFGIAPLGWYLVFTSMHVLNGFILFRLARKTMSLWGLHGVERTALFGALFFLLSPYQTEVLVWRVCFNFLLSSFLVLITLNLVVKWLELRDKWFLYLAHFTFILSLFTFELGLTIPFLCGIYLLFWTVKKGAQIDLWPRLMRLTLPQLSLVGIYFVLNKILLGTWIGHYGASVHLRFIWQEIAGNFYRFLTKFGFFLRYFEHPIKEKVFLGISQDWILYSLIGLSLILFIQGIRNFKKWSARLQLAALFLLLFVFALTPVLNLYFNYLQLIANDRYGYLASAFFLIGIALFFSLLPKLGQYLTAILWLGVSSFLLHKTNQNWQQSTQVYRALLQDFSWYDKNEVYILNLPDNMNGAFMFRDYSGQDFCLSDALRYLKRKPYEGKIFEVAQYNMTKLEDGVKVERDSSNQFKVTFNQWGNWWWRRGLGATNYENEVFQFQNKGHHYELILKKEPTNAIIIYQDGPSWKVVE